VHVLQLRTLPSKSSRGDGTRAFVVEAPASETIADVKRLLCSMRIAELFVARKASGQRAHQVYNWKFSKLSPTRDAVEPAK